VLHEEVSPAGIDIVTVALNADIEAARPFDEAARPTHPSLIDQAHVTADLLGMTNVPSGVWIDEDGTIVRPAEPALMPTDVEKRATVLARLPEDKRRIVEEMSVNNGDQSRYEAAVRDWAADGAGSRYVLSEDEVIRRSRPRPIESGLAAAHFDLAQYLHHAGFPLDAVPHFRDSHRLDPTNWHHFREALSLVDPEWGEVYERDLFGEVDAVGAETFYPPLDM
jgi:hypothetical protein